MRSNLEKAIAKMRKARGSPQLQLQRESALTRFIAQLPPSVRVLCRGAVHLPSKSGPAVLTYDIELEEIVTYAPLNLQCGIRTVPVSAFHSLIPHVGIAREVLAGPETTAIAMETHRAETVEQGSVAKP